MPASGAKPGLIFILPTRSSFMRLDAELLAAVFRLKVMYLNQDRSKLAYLAGILRALVLLARSRMCSPVLIWFADYHAAPLVLLARMLGQRSYLLIGGYDAVHYPEFGYGVYHSRLRGCCARLALRSCHHIIANHPALLSSTNTYYDPSGHPEGVYRLIPGLGTPASVIHNAVIGEETSASPQRPQDSVSVISDGASASAGTPCTGGRRSALTDVASASAGTTPARIPQILTVGSTPRLQDFYNKGYDLLASVAARRPDLRFVWVGVQSRWLPELNRLFGLEGLSNLILIPHLAQDELHALMRRCAVYAQPSISEGMPNALLEAMQMGCLPVGSNVAGIPTVIGDWGFIIDRRDDRSLEAALDQALASEPDREAISCSIRERFSRELRRERLLNLLQRES